MNTTKQNIADSLKRLLLKKPISRITIKDITEDCHISRMTFYYHFNDIYDLVEWICEEDARRALGENRTIDTWEQGFVDILKVVRENRSFVVNVYHAIDRTNIERYLAKMMERLLLAVIDEQSKGINISEEDKRYIANFFMYGFIGVMLEWIHFGMKEEPEKVAEITGKIIQGDFRQAIERLAETT
ncbi:MAG: TetR family transcriptional regulator [Clostridiales bacterium]|nr:TetR family transcriptional regulator [Clostridiales bacterium]